MKVGIASETYPGENRVALVPAGIAALKKAGLEVLVQQGAGQRAGFLDQQYAEKGATLVSSREELFRQADIVLQVRVGGANPTHGKEDLKLYREGQVVIGHADPLSDHEAVKQLAETKAMVFALELLPRITRAQSMDVLSSMATVAGYKAVLLAAAALPRMFPLLMTAAGTVTPARVFVMGAGVAGLQAIATARRLGAVVQAYDVREAVKEQVESLGAKFVVLDLQTQGAEASGGYAKEMGEEFLRKQREAMTKVLAESNVVITTAAVPGKKAPTLVTADMVKAMAPGSIILDLAAERGGNCELTRPGETVDVDGVSIMGPVNLPATIPYHASEMYSKNISTFLLHLVKEGQVTFNRKDEIHRDTLIASDGDVTNSRVRELAGMEPLPEPEPEPAPAPEVPNTIPLAEIEEKPTPPSRTPPPIREEPVSSEPEDELIKLTPVEEAPTLPELEFSPEDSSEETSASPPATSPESSSPSVETPAVEPPPAEPEPKSSPAEPPQAIPAPPPPQEPPTASEEPATPEESKNPESSQEEPPGIPPDPGSSADHDFGLPFGFDDEPKKD